MHSKVYPVDGPLAALSAHEAAAREFFGGLLDRLPECLATDRLDNWRSVGHLAIDYFSSDFHVETEKRALLLAPNVNATSPAPSPESPAPLENPITPE